jgi:serine/threonine protein kinase HipA of HipAB toxin-antitoxin module
LNPQERAAKRAALEAAKEAADKESDDGKASATRPAVAPAPPTTGLTQSNWAPKVDDKATVSSTNEASKPSESSQETASVETKPATPAKWEGMKESKWAS